MDRSELSADAGRGGREGRTDGRVPARPGEAEPSGLGRVGSSRENDHAPSRVSRNYVQWVSVADVGDRHEAAADIPGTREDEQ